MDNIAEETYFFVTHMFNLIYFKAFSFIIETYGVQYCAHNLCSWNCYTVCNVYNLAVAGEFVF